MAGFENDPKATSAESNRRGRVSWAVLVILLVAIIAAIAMVSHRPGAATGGRLSGDSGAAPQQAGPPR